jgi:hypothetical protein
MAWGGVPSRGRPRRPRAAGSRPRGWPILAALLLCLEPDPARRPAVGEAQAELEAFAAGP